MRDLVTNGLGTTTLMHRNVTYSCTWTTDRPPYSLGCEIRGLEDTGHMGLQDTRHGDRELRDSELGVKGLGDKVSPDKDTGAVSHTQIQRPRRSLGR